MGGVSPRIPSMLQSPAAAQRRSTALPPLSRWLAGRLVVVGGELMKRISPEIDFKDFADGASAGPGPLRRHGTADTEKACIAIV